MFLDTLRSGQADNLSPHKIAKLSNCEQKVELRQMHGQVVTDEMSK